MDQNEPADFNRSPLVNLAITMGVRIVSVQAVFEVSEGSHPLTAVGDAKPPLRTYSSTVAN